MNRSVAGADVNFYRHLRNKWLVFGFAGLGSGGLWVALTMHRGTGRIAAYGGAAILFGVVALVRAFTLHDVFERTKAKQGMT